MFYSQYGEDQWLAKNVALPDKGTLLEVGVGDWKEGSNSLYFENRGWEVFLVEPDWRHYEGILKNRPRAKLIPCALGGEVGFRNFVLTDDATLSGFLRQQGQSIMVPVFRLQDLGLEELDIISIDTEGTELEVWAGRGTLRPSVVIVEHLTIPFPSQESEIRKQFEKDGYQSLHRTVSNLIFKLL
jgi:FkbM family methyltransferase